MCSQILKGCIDLHVHSDPGIFPRSIDDYQLGKDAVKAGMKHVVVKAHEGSSVFRTKLINKLIKQDILVGSIVLNSFVGGFNIDAVDCAVSMGAKIVWMPTISAANHIQYYGNSGYSNNMKSRSDMKPLQPQCILNDDGDLKPELVTILQLARDYDVAIATGHLSPKESMKLIDYSLKMGLKKIILTHPDADITKINLNTQKELAAKGVFIEKAFLWVTEKWKACSLECFAHTIKEIGPEQCVISTDLGSNGVYKPVEGFEYYIKALMDYGIKYKDIKLMAQSNPAYLLGTN